MERSASWRSVGTGRSRIAVERPTSRLSKRMTWKPWPGELGAEVLVPGDHLRREPHHEQQRGLLGVAEGLVCDVDVADATGLLGHGCRPYPRAPATTRPKPPKIASDSARWPGRCSRSAARASASVTPASPSAYVPLRVPVLERVLVELGVELHAPRALAGAEALARAGRGAQQLDGPAGEREAVLVPVDARGARRERAEHRVAVGGRERLAARASRGGAARSRRTAPPSAWASSWAPRHTPSTGTPRSVASRSSAACGASVGVERGLLAAQRHDAVDLAERRERVAVAQEALVQAQPRRPRSAGPAWPRNGRCEVVQDGDDGAVGHPAEASRTAVVRLPALASTCGP